MKRMINAAEEADKEAALKDRLDQIEDDFSYLIEGLNHVSIDDANTVADSIDESIQACIAEIANIISE